MATQKKLEFMYVGEEDPKTIWLPRTRISPKLLELIDEHITKNGIESRSFFIRSALNHAVNISVDDLLTSMIPFMKRPPKHKRRALK